MKSNLTWIFSVPLFRLLAINLAIGIAAALLMTAGLLVLNPYGLRELLFSDASGGVAAALLLFGFVVTFGSTAMGSAIMAIGSERGPRGGKRATETPAMVKLSAEPRRYDSYSAATRVNSPALSISRRSHSGAMS